MQRKRNPSRKRIMVNKRTMMNKRRTARNTSRRVIKISNMKSPSMKNQGVQTKKSSDQFVTNFGSWSFLLGIIVAVLAGISLPTYLGVAIPSLIIILGFISGLLNVTKKETTPFLFASVSLVLVSWFGGSVIGNVVVIGPYLLNMFNNILIFVIPAVIVVSLKTIFALESEE